MQRDRRFFIRAVRNIPYIHIRTFVKEISEDEVKRLLEDVKKKLSDYAIADLYKVEDFDGRYVGFSIKSPLGVIESEHIPVLLAWVDLLENRKDGIRFISPIRNSDGSLSYLIRMHKAKDPISLVHDFYVDFLDRSRYSEVRRIEILGNEKESHVKKPYTYNVKVLSCQNKSLKGVILASNSLDLIEAFMQELKNIVCGDSNDCGLVFGGPDAGGC